MPSTKALQYAVSQIEKLDISIIAPQHGIIFHTPESIRIAIQRLKELDKVGIDGFLLG
jgi:flavorubredoxin